MGRLVQGFLEFACFSLTWILLVEGSVHAQTAERIHAIAPDSIICCLSESELIPTSPGGAMPDSIRSATPWLEHALLVKQEKHWEYWLLNSKDYLLHPRYCRSEQFQLNDSTWQIFSASYMRYHEKLNDISDISENREIYHFVVDLEQQVILMALKTHQSRSVYEKSATDPLQHVLISREKHCEVTWKEGAIEIGTCLFSKLENNILDSGPVKVTMEECPPGRYKREGNTMVSE